MQTAHIQIPRTQALLAESDDMAFSFIINTVWDQGVKVNTTKMRGERNAASTVTQGQRVSNREAELTELKNSVREGPWPTHGRSDVCNLEPIRETETGMEEDDFEKAIQHLLPLVQSSGSALQGAFTNRGTTL
ncbi:hypothetical protein AOLI_G00060740 [Acnodon oligacanthus]